MDIIIITESSHLKSDSYKENDVVSRTTNNRTDRTYTYLSPEFDPGIDSSKRTLMIALSITTDINIKENLL